VPELRQSRFTKEWVIISTERAKRPEDLKVDRTSEAVPEFVTTCPFCPGNEAKTPPESMRVPAGNRDWQVRVVPNKFPVLMREGTTEWRVERSRHSVGGFGMHDVIIETPNHALTMALLPVAHVEIIIQTYKECFARLSADPRIAHVVIFKNHGAGAGTSLVHPHSQVVGTPIVSSMVRARMYEAMRHHDEYGECMVCAVLGDELQDRARVIAETQHFVALAPFASATPFSMSIIPRRHMASFGDISSTEVKDLSRVLHDMLARLYFGLNNPDFNYTIITAPAENAGVKYYHWYMSIVPRLTQVAGFELGSGILVNTVQPEAAAEFMRGVNWEEAAAAGQTGRSTPSAQARPG
jgi:UDPglucose--hexose-1-phosphate uridylyltransferase